MKADPDQPVPAGVKKSAPLPEAMPPIGLRKGGMLPATARPLSYRSLVRWAIDLIRVAFVPFAASTFVALAATLLTQFGMKVIAGILNPEDGDRLQQSRVLLYAIVVIAMIAARFGGRVLGAWADTRMLSELQQKLHDRLLSLDSSYHKTHELGETSTIVLQLAGGAQQILRDFAGFPILNGIPMIYALVTLMHDGLGKLTAMPPTLEIAIALALVAFPVAGARLARGVQRAMGATQHAQVELATEFANSASQPMEVRLLGAERQRAAAFARRLRDSTAARMASTIQLAVVNEFQSAVPMLLQTSLLVYAAFILVDTHSSNLGSILVIYFFVPQVTGPVQSLMGFNVALRSSWPIVAQVGELLDAETPRAATLQSAPTTETVSLADVALRYRADVPPVLDGITHTFPPGRISGIAGRAGSGKSSIFQLINGLRPPTSGAVRLGEVETFAMDPATLRECIATVSQYPLFIADTVRANFLLANEQATDAEIEAACRKTGLWPVIAAASPSDPLGMLMSRTPGQGFSGGELRLFAITRALLRRPKVLLLDEPTSGIDELGTESLARTLPGLLDGLTVIVIDHRPNFLKQIADEVCCLENGRFVDVGTPAELESRPSLFQRLRSAQETMAVSNMNVESVPLPVLRASSAPIAEVGAGLAKQAS